MTPAQAARQVRRMDPEAVTVELWLRCWSEWFPGERIEATVVHDEYMLAPFLRAHGGRPLRSLTRLEAQSWAVAHPSQVRYLRRVWGKALTVGVVAENVWDRVELGPRRRRDTSPPSLERLDAILAGSRARGGWWVEFADLCEVAAFTGARLGGLVSLRRDAVDLSARRLTLVEKGAKTRVVVLTPRALEALERAVPRRYPGPLVFLSALRRTLDRDSVGAAWRRVRGEFPGSFHSLKHFAATWLLTQGLSKDDVAIQLGHTDAAGRPYTRLVERVYGHPDHAEALARVEAAVSG